MDEIIRAMSKMSAENRVDITVRFTADGEVEVEVTPTYRDRGTGQ